MCHKVNSFLPDHFNDFLIWVSIVRLKAKTVDLPQDNSKWPNIWLWGKLSIQNTLRGHPPDREEWLGLNPVVVHCIDVPGQAKIWDFDSQVFPHQTVPCCQVSMDVVMTREKFHSSWYLLPYSQKLIKKLSGFQLKKAILKKIFIYYKCLKSELVWNSNFRHPYVPKTKLWIRISDT